MNVLHPSCAWPPQCSPPILWRRFKDGLASVCVVKYSCKMPKESETTGHADGWKWSLVGSATDVGISASMPWTKVLQRVQTALARPVCELILRVPQFQSTSVSCTGILACAVIRCCLSDSMSACISLKPQVKTLLIFLCMISPSLSPWPSPPLQCVACFQCHAWCLARWQPVASQIIQGPFDTLRLGLQGNHRYRTPLLVWAMTEKFTFAKQLPFCGRLMVKLKILCVMYQHKKFLTHVWEPWHLGARGLCSPSLIGCYTTDGSTNLVLQHIYSKTDSPGDCTVVWCVGLPHCCCCCCLVTKCRMR